MPELAGRRDMAFLLYPFHLAEIIMLSRESSRPVCEMT